MIKALSAEAFRRSVGIERRLFDERVSVLARAEAAKKKRGRPSLSLENQLCMTLSYWREYRTFFHLGLSYGVHESNAYRIVTRVESRLAESGVLALVKPTAASSAEPVVIRDASEVPIHRPQKNKQPTTAARNTPTR